MIDQLFGSKTRVKLLKMFYSNPNRSFYVREITRKIDEQINSVRRELSNLLSIGIIASDTNNNKLYYEVNQTYEYYQPLRDIFGEDLPANGVADDKAAAKENGKKAVKKPVIQASDPAAIELAQTGNVEFAMFTGQFTRDESSGIDLLVVGDVNQTKLQKFITALEEKEKKEIRYVLMPLTELEYRQNVKDRFISKVLESKKQVLIDKRTVTEE